MQPGFGGHVEYHSGDEFGALERLRVHADEPQVGVDVEVVQVVRLESHNLPA